MKWSEASQFNNAAAEDGGANSVALGLLFLLDCGTFILSGEKTVVFGALTNAPKNSSREATKVVECCVVCVHPFG